MTRIAACAAAISALPASAIEVACLGDSITEGVGLTNVTTPWPAVMEASLGASYNVTNLGNSGDTTTLLKARYCADCIDAGPFDFVVFEIGTNDIQGTSDSAATIYARALEMLNDSCARGFHVVVVDVMPRQFNATKEQVRDDLNALYESWVTTDHPSTCSASWVDMSAILDTNNDGTLDAAYQNGVELVHPDQDGMNAIAEAVALVIAP